jgi:iron complex transport system ATP-binding protein
VRRPVFYFSVEKKRSGILEDMITVEGLSIKLNGQGILHQAALQALPGEVTVLLGPNGSGKTTLLRCISAELRPQVGAVTLAGRRLSDLSRRDVAQLLALVPQEHHPVFPYTVREMILLGRVSRVGFWSQPGTRDQEVVSEIIELLGIGALAHKSYTRISGGERQLVIIGRGLAQEPRVLLLDEPTTHLDFKNQMAVLKLVKELARGRGLTVLLTLHDPNLALLFGDQAILLAEGRVVAQGLPGDVITAASMAQLYGLEVEMLSQGSQKFLAPKLS